MNSETILIIIGMGIATYLPRWLPLFVLSRYPLPHWLVDWLDFIPAAILSALIFPSLVIAGEPRHLEWCKPDLWIAVPTLLFAFKTKSLAGTVLFGMFLYWLASTLYPG
ncbi:MAG: AzlD domain-containing protein [Syntrophales bacterium]